MSLKQDKKKSVAVIKLLKDNANDVRGLYDLFVCTMSTYDASAKTADDMSAFVEHIRADIAAWAELYSKQDKAKAAKEEEKQQQKSGTGGKSLIKIFAGKK